MALRIRVDRPELSPGDVRSLLVQAAEPIPGVGLTDQGAGVAKIPGAFPVAIEPVVISGYRAPTGPTQLPVKVRNLTAADAELRLALTTPAGNVVPPGAPVPVAAGATAEFTLEIPPGSGAFIGTAVVIDAAGQSIGFAPVYAGRAPAVPKAALRVPEVRASGDTVEARVSIGVNQRSPGSLTVAPLHDVGLWLVPSGGGAPIRMAGAKQAGDWPVGMYRFVLTRRRADGKELAAGRYRLRVEGTGADGIVQVRESKGFRLR